MISRFDMFHDVVVAEDGRDGEEPSRERFPQNEDIGSDIVVLHAQKLPCPSDASLDFVANQQGIVFLANFFGLLQVTSIAHYNTYWRNNYSLFSLNRLNHIAYNVAVVLEFSLEGLG